MAKKPKAPAPPKAEKKSKAPPSPKPEKKAKAPPSPRALKKKPAASPKRVKTNETTCLVGRWGCMGGTCGCYSSAPASSKSASSCRSQCKQTCAPMKVKKSKTVIGEKTKRFGLFSRENLRFKCLNYNVPPGGDDTQCVCLCVPDEKLQLQPVKYPRSVFFIISNEFCERFNYYGMRTILVLYLTCKLHFDDDTSTVFFHVFTMLVYLCPLVGAIIADSWLGKYKTILYLSIVYALGGVIVAIGAIPTLSLPVKAATITGLILIAIGTGGIKPCVAAFGGDQFRLPEQAKQLATFFSLFYFAINAGSMISTTLTPILREDVHCFGDRDCFSLAFGVPAVLMLVSVLIFVAGKNMYVMKPPAGNMIFGVSKCISDAIGGWRRERKTNPREHWLDYATPRSGHKMVSDTKTLLKILVLYLPFPVFWALFDQQGSRWTFQATRMDGEIWGYTVKPDQMQVVNPLLILGFIPLFDYVLYPVLSKFGIKRPLQKLTLGGLLAALAFVLSACVELRLEETEPQVPNEMSAQLRVYNGMPCRYSFSTDVPLEDLTKPLILEPFGLWEEKNLLAPQTLVYKFNADSDKEDCPSIAGEFTISPGQAVSYFVADDGLHEFIDTPGKPKLGNPKLRVMLNIPRDEVPATLIDPADEATEVASQNATQLLSVARGKTDLRINGKLIASVDTKSGGYYAMLVQGNERDGYNYDTHVITRPNSIHMFWQLPQIIVITAAEIMFSVTGLEFSFTQAPQSMKSVLQACWLLSVAIGNMLVVVIAELKFFPSQAAEFMLFAGLMIVDMFIFMLLAMRYKYVENSLDPEADPANAGTPRLSGGKQLSIAGSPSQSSRKSSLRGGTNGHSNSAYVDNER